MSRFTILTALAAFTLSTTSDAADRRQALQFFESKIRPILVQHCLKCHGATGKPKGGLRLDSAAGLNKGGESGKVVQAGKANESLLMEALRHESLAMPPNKRLPRRVIADFERWINDGAVYPLGKVTKPGGSWRETYRRRLSWWSLQPVRRPKLPAATAAALQPIDRFIGQALDKAKLRPAPPADRRTLARRLSFVLLGLPPNAPRVAAFVEDRSPDAYERLVDETLSSPHFGERWARHWMDVVRYTDTYGYEWDVPAKGAWRYRDYLIRAANSDVAYDQLVREQIAGDLLPRPRLNHTLQLNESMLGPMFYQMGEKRHGDSSEFNGIHQEMLDNKIDAFSKAFQATTIACARCHDHKLDAIAQKEYYALGGVFMSSKWVTHTVDLPSRYQQRLAGLNKLKDKIKQTLVQRWRKQLRDTNALSAILDKPRPKAGDRFTDLAHPLVLAKPDKVFTGGWARASKVYQAERQRRQRHNGAHFKIAIDFRKGVPDGWELNGIGTKDLVKCGDFVVALNGRQVVAQVLPGGIYTHSLSTKLNGALRSPYLNRFKNGHISFECAGGDFAVYRTVIDNAFLTEKQVYLSNRHPQWKLLSTYRQHKQRHVFIEFATKTSNPNFPPRVGLGGVRLKPEQINNPRSWFGITRVALHEAPFTPLDDLERFANLFKLGKPQNVAAAKELYRRWFTAAVDAWSHDRATPEDVRLLNDLIDSGVLQNGISANKKDPLTKLVRAYRRHEAEVPAPRTVHGMSDNQPGYDYKLNIRGNYDDLGSPVPRGYLSCLGSGPLKAKGSGRLELAKAIASSQNPLTARVYVNRVWHWLFGQGLVRTPNDFGHLGAKPTHPELLDYLTAQFIAGGWSPKQLVRCILLSRTWRQSGKADRKSTDQDPDNLRWHHYPLRRLEAEAIRDAMLSVSGRLDKRLYGRTTDPHRANEDAEKYLFSGPVDGLGRRALYTRITIMEPPKFLATFNQPEPKIPTGRRDVTNTPAQSLALLNDPFVIGQAKVWAQQVVRRPGGIAARLRSMFARAYGRPIMKTELDRWSKAVSDLARLHRRSDSEVRVWQDVAHALFNTKEFIYIR